MMRTPTLPALALLMVATVASTSAGCSCGSDDESTGGNPSTGPGGGGVGGLAAGGNGGSGGSGGGAGGEGGGEAEACIYVPPAGEFSPQIECAWHAPPANGPYALRDDVVMTPVVVNLTDDNGDGQVDTNDIPDIAFVAYRLQEDGCCNQNGALRVLSGACNPDGTMTEHFAVGATEIQADTGIAGIWLDNSGGLAAGDIDGDGSVDLVGTIVNGGTIAFERTGRVKWINTEHPSRPMRDHLAGTTPSIADIDHDGKPEIIQGRVVLNGEDGSLKWKGTGGVGINAFLGPVSTVGDPDLDGNLNVLAGNTMYAIDGTPLWTYDFPVASSSANCGAPNAYPCDGFTAVGNFDDDDYGEIVIVRAGVIYILNHDGTPLEVGGAPVRIDIPRVNCTLNEGGPPTIADFDGDGDAEIGVAGADYYVVADLECLAEPLPPQCSDPGIRWKVRNDDCSSRSTGSSVFDFDGDGKAEVVYNDERFFRVMSGVDGTVLLEVPNNSHTRLEMPIVVDVDNDGNAEIIFVENASGSTPAATDGIQIWGDPTDSWVPTRRIWNQHAYHVTNVSELGAIPMNEPPNWLAATDATVAGVMNNFRQNLPSFDRFAAPDITLDLTLNAATCPAYLSLVADVCNRGALVVGAGVQVRFYNNLTRNEITCANAPVATTQPLSPGQCEAVICEWANAPSNVQELDVRGCADNEGYDCASNPATGGNNECHEDNNAGDGKGPSCLIPE
ncbi:FG-GAP repeat domain-containing protein [Chondromyces crocatus]|uniref:Hemolysin n=1 Tax=Chondromyces crocatus TaxID=52 RepID=A0A0K1ECR6_CHOCO|nr:VCBS repeat-containing protein [Chondromyces crocatus]AKT38660.1 uncharacterized protein CMC5_028080 [Chondromyces crocatus]